MLIERRPITIDQGEAFRAILPKYPAEETAAIIDLNGMAIATSSEGFFPVAARSIAEQTHRYLHTRFEKRNIKHLSVFALAPAPLLIYFGYLLGEIDHVDLYQRNRDSQNWIWKDEAEGGREGVVPRILARGTRRWRAQNRPLAVSQ